MMMFVADVDHCREVLARVQSVKHTLWIGTADFKDLYVGGTTPELQSALNVDNIL